MTLREIVRRLEAVLEYYVDVNSPWTDKEEKRVVTQAERALARLKELAG